MSLIQIGWLLTVLGTGVMAAVIVQVFRRKHEDQSGLSLAAIVIGGAGSAFTLIIGWTVLSEAKAPAPLSLNWIVWGMAFTGVIVVPLFGIKFALGLRTASVGDASRTVLRRDLRRSKILVAVALICALWGGVRTVQAFHVPSDWKPAKARVVDFQNVRQQLPGSGRTNHYNTLVIYSPDRPKSPPRLPCDDCVVVELPGFVGMEPDLYSTVPIAFDPVDTTRIKRTNERIWPLVGPWTLAVTLGLVGGLIWLQRRAQLKHH